MKQIQLKAMGKINLGLDVLGKRPDGYHEVRMVMQTVNLYDRIRITAQAEPGIVISTNLSFLPTNEDNIMYKAADLMIREFSLDMGVSISLEKHIPVAAGMAGGSTDAAAVLYGMNRMFCLGLDRQQLMDRGVKLGADVPYCILRGTALAEGIGEKLTPLPPMPDCWILLAKPPISVSTKYVYEHLDLMQVQEHPDIDGIVQDIRANQLSAMCAKLGNVLETVTEKRYDRIAQIKSFMLSQGAMTALMSGSGPTVFGIFEEEAPARDAAQELKLTGLARQVYVARPFHA